MEITLILLVTVVLCHLVWSLSLFLDVKNLKEQNSYLEKRLRDKPDRKEIDSKTEYIYNRIERESDLQREEYSELRDALIALCDHLGVELAMYSQPSKVWKVEEKEED